jgi:hypothetical protein
VPPLWMNPQTPTKAMIHPATPMSTREPESCGTGLSISWGRLLGRYGVHR